jgi:phage terminase large subunit-like protein
MAFAGPTRQFRLMVNSQRLQHDGNPLLTWQIGHCETKTDPNNNERPVKPKTHDVRKIDGVVAAIMALDGVNRLPEQFSAYDDHPLMYANEV